MPLLPMPQLPLYPLLKAGLITAEDIIIDAKSGEGAIWVVHFMGAKCVATSTPTP